MKTGIIGAVAQEVELLFEALSASGHPVKISRKGFLEFREGVLSGERVVVVCCGVGKVNAALCAQILISAYAVERIVNTGSAGALDERLAVYDLVVSTDLVQHDFDTTAFGYEPGRIPGMDSLSFAADPLLHEIALVAFMALREHRPDSNVELKMLEGRIASGDVFVADEKLRERIRDVFSPLCVEMEGAAIAQVCQVSEIPFVIIRSVSDLAGSEATVSYEDFSREASRVSARLVIAMMTALAERS